MPSRRPSDASVAVPSDDLVALVEFAAFAATARPDVDYQPGQPGPWPAVVRWMHRLTPDRLAELAASIWRTHADADRWWPVLLADAKVDPDLYADPDCCWRCRTLLDDLGEAGIVLEHRIRVAAGVPRTAVACIGCVEDALERRLTPGDFRARGPGLSARLDDRFA